MLWYSKAVLERRRGDPNTDGTRDREGEVEAAASEGIIWAAALSQPEDGGDIPQEGPTTEDMPGEVEGGGGGGADWIQWTLNIYQTVIHIEREN
jgi:hypothetical protein